MACENQIIKATDASGMIRIGVWDTLNVRSQQFDISEWLEQFPGGTLSVLHQRSGDPMPYPVANVVVSDDGVATWTFDETDSAVSGYGSASLLYQVGEEYKARSVPFPTYTASTVGESGVEPPSPWEDWYQRVLEASQAAQDAAENAEASETAAGESAAQASASATAAQGSASQAAASESTASQAATAAQAAQQASEAAQTGAQSAQTAAEAAQAAAEEAEAGAETAQSAAEVAEAAAASSATAAANSAAAAAASAASAASKILAAFPTTSAGPAAIVSVDDGADGIPIKSLSVAVEPVQSGSGDPSPSNVRPISGWNAVKIARSDDNLYDSSTNTDGYYIDASLQLVENVATYLTDYIPIMGGSLYVSTVRNAGSSSAVTLRATWFDDFYNALSQDTKNVSATTLLQTFTVPTGAAFVRLSSNKNIQPFVGVSFTDYQTSESNAATYTFPFSTTQYGGTFTLTYDGTWSAKMVVDKTVIDLSAVDWPTSQTSWGAWAGPAQSTLAGLPAYANVMCDTYKPLNYSAVRNGTTPSIAVGQTSDPQKLYVRTGSTAKPTGMLVAPAATPQTISWTEAELLEILGADGFTTLLGNNNVWADAGETSMEYRQDVGIVIGKLLAAQG